MTKDETSKISIDANLAKQIEEELHAVLRRQINRSGPVPLPRKDFGKKFQSYAIFLKLK